MTRTNILRQHHQSPPIRLESRGLLFFRFFAAAYERVSLGIGSHWPFEDWGRFLPEHTSTVSMLDRLIRHAVVVVTQGESFRMREVRSRGGGLPKL